MSEMERRAQAAAQKETEKFINETRGMVIGLAAILSSMPEAAAIDMEKVKELSRQLTRGSVGSMDLQRGVDLVLQVMKTARSAP